MNIIRKFCDAWKLCGTKHDWIQCRKKPITIKAIKMDKSFTVGTREGMMDGKAGDYLLEGIEGEVYPCDKDIFLNSYLDIRRRKIKELEGGN